MSSQLNVAIIGCGRVAGHHARSIDKISELKLVAVCDLKTERANDLARAHNVPAFTNYYEMLTQLPEVDVVSIITPSGMHFEHTMDVIENFKKHVVVEKPIVMRLSQAERLIKATTKNETQIFPVFQYRFNKAVQRVRKAIVEKELGDVLLSTIRTRWCRPQRYYDRDPWRGTFALDGGACTNQGIHHLDLLRYLAGEVKRVNSLMTTKGVSIEVEDTVVATMEFISGATGVIEITTAARPDDFESSISIVGSKGLAMVGGWATNELIQFSPDRNEEKLNSEVFPDVYGFGHTQIYQGVCDTLLKKGKPAVEYDDAIKSIELLQAIYKSDEVRNWVEIGKCGESARLGEPNENLADLYRTPKPSRPFH